LTLADVEKSTGWSVVSVGIERHFRFSSLNSESR
jgi:hypothetical protein